MTRRRQKPSKPKPRFHGLDMLPTIGSLIDEQVKDAAGSYATLALARNKPHVLDDPTVDHIIRVRTEMLENADYLEEQLARWKREPLTASQGAEVERLVGQMIRYRDGCNRMLALARELKKGTIDSVLRMSDEEAGMAYLLGLLGGTRRSHSAPSIPPFDLPDEVTTRPVTGPNGEIGFEFRHTTLELLGYLFLADNPRGGIDINAMVADNDPTVPPETRRQRREYFGPLADRLIDLLELTIEGPAH